jgi:RimJ/RimL family protein N-acetyltransferase
VSGTLETQRLLLVPWSVDDVALLAELSSDSHVTRYIGRGRPWTAAQAIEVSDRQADHWHEHGFGWRIAIEKTSGESIGFIALNFMEPGTALVDPGTYEIGWWLGPGAWGRGYAGEGGRAVRDDAFQRLGAPDLTARIQPANAASIGVSRSLGLTHRFDTTGRHGEPVSIFRLEAPGQLT